MITEKTKSEYGKACVEVISILKQFPEEYYKKISPSFINFLEANKSLTYKYNAPQLDKINKDELLHETQMLILIIFYKFLATEEERREMKEKLSENERKYIQEQNEKYSYENLFLKEENETKERLSNSEYNESLPVEYKKENIFNKFISFINNIFKKRS